jgi:60 kDa SS-A/Ro ribonucleoprotein
MRTNKANVIPAPTTHGGAKAAQLTPYKELRRSVLSALLGEDQFYESGADHSARVRELVKKVEPQKVADLAVEARNQMYLRHVPLMLVRELARAKGNGTLVAETLEKVIQRPDELTEYLALYWKENKDAPLSAGSKRGLARAIQKFNAYSLGKYKQADKAIKLRDVLRIVHPKPKDQKQGADFKGILDGSLEAPDTWEVALSSGADKKATWERLLRENKLGGLAFLRNLRNMTAAGVDKTLIRNRFNGNFDKVLPFRFISAAVHAPEFEREIDTAMLRAAEELPKLKGTTVLLVDVSGSMSAKLSTKTELSRLDTAFALAALVREQAETPIIIATAGDDWTRIHKTQLVPARRGMALIAALHDVTNKLGGGGIFLVQAMKAAKEIVKERVDRVIVLTDEQDTDYKLKPADVETWADKNYMINVASYKNGIGYGQKWTAHIDGWSENVIRYIQALEAEDGGQ